MLLGLNKRNINTYLYTENKNLGSLLQEVGSYRILIPGFQRNYEWSKEQIALLIDSLSLGIPIPPIYLHRTSPDDTQYNILDGQQRIFGLYLYYNNLFFSKEYKHKDNSVSYKLKGIHMIPKENYSDSIKELISEHETTELDKLMAMELTKNKKFKNDFKSDVYFLRDQEITYSELSFEDQLRFLNFSIPVVYLTSDELFAQSVFKMINTTSKRLKEQQIRDSIYYKFFLNFYNELDNLRFLIDSKREYVIVEDTFELLIKYHLIKDHRNFKDLNITFKTQKQNLLDKCSHYLTLNSNKSELENILSSLKELTLLKENNLKKLNKNTKTAFVILSLLYKDKQLEILEKIIFLEEIISSTKEIKNLKIEDKKLKKYFKDINFNSLKYYSTAEFIIKYFQRRLN